MSSSTTVTTTTCTYAKSTGFPPCDALIQAGLGHRLLLPTDSAYESRIESWWSLNSRLHPWCIVQPHNAHEVSLTLKTLVRAGDDKSAGEWHIAVRSGGHGPAYANSVDNGVTIDLAHINQTSYNRDTNIASIGAGGRWANVLAELQKEGVLVPGGRDGNVGVGGFLLGGGLNYFMGRHGLGCDSVRNFEVVLADGRIVDANENENSDLWRALKGGSNNFGIVTRFDMEALPSTDIAYGLRMMSADHTSDFIDAVVDFTDHYHEHDGDALVPWMMHISRLPHVDVVAAAIYVNTEGVENSPAFDKIKQIPNMSPDRTFTDSYAVVAERSQMAGGAWNGTATLTFKNDKRILTRVVELHNQFVQTLMHDLGGENFDSMTFLQPLPGLFGDISTKKGGNMLGLETKHNSIMWTGGITVKTSQDDYDKAHDKLMSLMEDIKSYAASVGGEGQLVYINYADPSQDSLGSYGKENVEFIRQVAAKYDPTAVFQERVPGGWKISRVGLNCGPNV
ncbi:Bifunctional solanapyrone synthase [Talaromyces islandicus]|uniref:Bifunctional solanapyrone synthase n=1 Tax=Talaromyces islandicus TaxID=28573 RepID=A0A0U1M0V3_TALIS|nr:Bifunctional solanapyrone synthase [Talaromyces islandicus]